MKTFSVEFLGCKVNAYEVEALREGFQALGMSEVPVDEGADLYVLNTCSVTTHAGATSRNRIRRARRSNPDARILVTGCYAESDRERVQEMEGVSRIFGNDEKEGIVRFVSVELLGRPAHAAVPPFRITRMGAYTRAFVKIEDGCDDACTFCIIPALRGPASSRDPDEIVEEATDLVRSGHREVVLTGVHLGYFGKVGGGDVGGGDGMGGQGMGGRATALLALLRRLSRIPGLARLKLSSIEVHEITAELIELFASSETFCPHFHLPLQAGCDRTLRRMRRKYNTELFARRLDALRSALPEPAFSTDVIVGFPGETDEDFEETLRFCRGVGFMKIHVFPYSVREGTPAAGLADHVAPEVIEERKRRLLAVDEELASRWRDGFLGRAVQVLVEGRRDRETGSLTGLTERYLRVVLDGPDRLAGQIVPARVTGPGPGASVRALRLTPMVAVR